MRRMVGDYDDFNKRKICTARDDRFGRTCHGDIYSVKGGGTEAGHFSEISGIYHVQPVEIRFCGRCGYRLSRAPEDYKVGEILRLTEGSLAPVSCLEAGAKLCEIAPHCRTLPMWTRLNSVINEFFDSYTIADLMKTEDGGDYVI